MPRSRMLARVAASLLVAPLPAATVAALPTSHAATVVAVDVDTDGDGLPDAGDGCPTVASTNPTGCPTASRQARLKWMEGRNRLQTRIISPVQSCASHARINLWRVRPHRDFKVLQVDASARGRYRFRVARGPRYFVTVSPSYSPGEAECAKAVSRKVRVPRA